MKLKKLEREEQYKNFIKTSRLYAVVDIKGRVLM
jgi:hypothetical protein